MDETQNRTSTERPTRIQNAERIGGFLPYRAFLVMWPPMAASLRSPRVPDHSDASRIVRSKRRSLVETPEPPVPKAQGRTSVKQLSPTASSSVRVLCLELRADLHRRWSRTERIFLVQEEETDRDELHTATLHL